ncbi:MAG: hypothetical protein LH481_09670 [Burkholderiales bacterium]|nr:hypothetical protein [Burkholderiales bacterium]
MNHFRRPLKLFVAFCAWFVAACSSSEAPVTVIKHGPFEIFVQGRDITSGGLGDTNNRARSTSEVTRFWVKYKGNLVTIKDGADGYASSTTKKDESRSMFWRAVRLTDAPTPTILVSTTHFWMITEENGALVTKTIEASLAEYQWLDADKGQPTEQKSFGIENVNPVSGTELRGGRWLRMNVTVLDVSTLRLYKVHPFIDGAPGTPFAGLQAGNSRAIAFSPGQTQYVTYAEGVEYESKGQPRYSALMVVDIPSATSYALKLIRKVNHYYDYQDLTPEWLAHYFQWTKNAQGVEKLSPRVDAKILPWIGRVNTSISGDVDYKIAPVSANIVPVLSAFMVDRIGAKQGPGYDSNNATFTLPGCAGTIKIYHHDKVVLALYPSGASTTDLAAPECHPLVAKIGEAFNAELKRGLHQAHFINE